MVVNRFRVPTIVVAAAAAVATAFPAAAPAASRAQTAQTLLAITRALPKGSSVYVREAETGTVLASRGSSTRRIPASVNKLLTASAALLLDGPDGRLRTELRVRGEIDDRGVLHGDLIVRGGGDPVLRTEQIEGLAAAARRAGIRRITGVLHADRARWTAQPGTPRTDGRYDSDVGGRIGPLVTMRGFSAGSADPARQVVLRLRDQLRVRGVAGVTVGATRPSGPGTRVIQTVQSPTMAALAASMNGPSDNFIAEMLVRGLGARHGRSGTTPSGTAVARTTLRRELRVSASMADGSGLSRGNRISAGMVVRLLDAMAARDEGTALRAGLPLAGATGTLSGRMRGTKAQGRCRAKTGTLRNVSSLAGWCTTAGGRNVSFAILQNGVSVAAARAQQNRIAATIAAWSDKPVKPKKPESGAAVSGQSGDDAAGDAADATTPQLSPAGAGGISAG